jgi:hypothetical protein
MSFKQIFADNKRIVALAANKNTGKTNNLLYLINEYRKENTTTPIYVYGFPSATRSWLHKLNVHWIDNLEQLSNKQNCILIIDEFQKLKLNDRRNKDLLREFVNFVYHKNVYVILSTPDIREYNTIIGGAIERWLLKSIKLSDCVNGSQLKEIIHNYKGEHKFFNNIELPPQNMIVINDNEEVVLTCKYILQVDTKDKLAKLF